MVILKMSEDYFDVKYELIPYDRFIGLKEFDFDKIIYDLNSQIELLSSQADNLDYVVAIASGIVCGLLDILWLESLICKENAVLPAIR